MNNAQNDSDSFEAQIQRAEIRARLVNLTTRKNIPAADREDIVSAIIEKAIRCQEEYDPRRASFSTWIVAIGKNVISTHFRKQTAQKRKPEGGTVSFDAESTGDDHWEPKDTCGPDRRSSEELEHLIETAKLSKKEQKAIASRLGKTDKTPGEKFSSSTGRRATRKMRQARADQEFHESPQGPDPLECAYGSIPAAERSAAVLFDQLRRTKWFVDAIDDWRKSAEWSNARAFLQKQTALKRSPLRILDQHFSEQLRCYRQAVYERDDLLHPQFEGAVDITLAFPEWPAVGYCQLAPGERRKRLEEFGWTFSVEPFWEISEPTFEIFAAAAEEDQQPSTTSADLLDRLNKSPKTGNDAYSSMHLVRIDWRYPMKTIMASFKRWAEAQPKHQLQQISQAGRLATTLLVGFAGIRLIDEFGLSSSQAMSWLKRHYGAPIPKTPERLERAVRAARDNLKHFLPPPAEIGI